MSVKKRKIYKKSDPLLPVEIPAQWALYHVQWGYKNSVVGKVRSIDYENKTVIMETMSTRMMWKFPVKWSDLRHTRKAQQNIENKKLQSNIKK